VDLAELRDVMRAPLVFDGRNLLDPSAAAAYGFQ
jgi:UDPglucose 6-dehydrogenase